MRRFIDLLTSQFVAFISNLKDLMEVFVSIPDTLFGGPGASSITSKILLILFKIVWLPVYAIGWLVLAPLRLFTDFSDERRRDFMFGLPALIVACFIAFVVISANAQSESIISRYRTKGERALIAQDFSGAKTFFGRILAETGDKSPDKGDVFNWALTLIQTGETKRGLTVLEGLAPSDAAGYPKAHRVQALNLAQNIVRDKDPENLKKLRWHLREARDTSFEINQAWAVYYMSVGQPDKALPYLERDAEKNPASLIDIARLHRGLGNKSAEERTLKRAEEVYRGKLEDDALDANMRVRLANVLVTQDNVAEAERIMGQGLQIARTPFMSQAMADFYVMRHDRARDSNEGFDQQFEFLRRAMTIDVNYTPVYQRFISLYESASDPDELKSVKVALQETVSGDKPTALAHFAFSNLLWMEGQRTDAEWHLEQAFQLDNNLVVVLNNLAWMLAHKEDGPDFDRALELSKKVVDVVPNDPRFRDTYATILMKMERFDEAIVEFKKTMLTIKDKKTVHKNLAMIYDKLGKPELARQHAENAK